MSARILTIGEVAAVLSVDPITVRTLIVGGELPVLVRVANEALISEGALREFIDQSGIGCPWEGLS